MTMYRCRRCGTIAASVEAVRTVDLQPEPVEPGDPSVPAIRIRFSGDHIKAVPAEAQPAIRHALDYQGTGGDLYALDPVLAPFHCVRCAADYCERCWDLFPLFDEEMYYDETKATCPSGHFTYILD